MVDEAQFNGSKECCLMAMVILVFQAIFEVTSVFLLASASVHVEYPYCYPVFH